MRFHSEMYCRTYLRGSEENDLEHLYGFLQELLQVGSEGNENVELFELWVRGQLLTTFTLRLQV